MKPLLVCPFVLLVAAATVGAQPAPSRIEGKVKINPRIRPQITPSAGSVLGNRERVGERYRLWLSFNPTDVNDSMYPGKRNTYDDHTFECYGQLSLNGQVKWRMDKKVANSSVGKVGHRNLPEPLKVNPRLQGYRLNANPLDSKAQPNVFEYESVEGNTAASTVQLKLKLYDYDNPVFFDDGPYNTPPDRNDDVFGDYKIDINLLKMKEGHYYWYWQGKDESGNTVGSNLFLYIEHVGPVYASKKPPVGEIHVIEKPQFPGKIPAPGPILKRRTR